MSEIITTFAGQSSYFNNQVKRMNRKTMQLLAFAALLSAATTAYAQTEQTVKTSVTAPKDYVTDIVLNGNKVILKLEQSEAITVNLLSTSIALTYKDPLTTSISDVEEERAGEAEPETEQVYDLQGRRVAEASGSLKKGIYIVNGKKRIVR